LNLSYFISKRISQEQKQGFASTIHKIAIGSIGIGLGASIVSFLILNGFQETIKNKIYNFSGHLIITKHTGNQSSEEEAMNYYTDAYRHPENYPNVKHLQEFAHKAGLVKADDEVLGVVVKGIGKSFDVEAFDKNIIEGKFISLPDSGYANQIVISKEIANKLKAKVNDQIVVHFFQNPPRSRKVLVTGIYESDLSEYFDSKIILGDIRLIQKLNDWSDSLAGGVEVFVRDINRLDDAGYAIQEAMDYDLNVERVSDKYSQVFEWLDLISRQVNIILVIILLVVCVNMISIVLILVMERTQMIGMLKALGAGNKLIRSIFVYNGMNLILKGLAFGNALGLGLSYIQDKFKVVKLNPHDYYMDVVPISWHWEMVALLNLLAFLVIVLVLLVPTAVISRINPIKAIRFD